MHETGIVRDVVHRLEAAARDAGAERVCSVDVWLGALSQFSPGHFKEHFSDESRGTVAQGAALHIVASEELSHPNAQDVMIQSVELEIPERSA
jgi:hydrogenase nickel incorporation protein HypA/HybF